MHERFLSLNEISRFKLAETRIGRGSTINLPFQVRKNYNLTEGTVLEWYAAHRDMTLPEEELNMVCLVVVRRRNASP